MAFLINGKLDWLGDLNFNDPLYFLKLKVIKESVGPNEICVGPAKILMPFAVEVFKLQFTEEPSYSKLKHFLIKILLTLDVYPDMRFDWTKTDDTNLS